MHKTRSETAAKKQTHPLTPTLYMWLKNIVAMFWCLPREALKILVADVLQGAGLGMPDTF